MLSSRVTLQGGGNESVLTPSPAEPGVLLSLQRAELGWDRSLPSGKTRAWEQEEKGQEWLQCGTAFPEPCWLGAFPLST